MNQILDIMGSVIIAGLVMLMLMKFNIFSNQAKFESDSELKLNLNAKTLADIINYDLRKIGYKKAGTKFIEILPKKVKFYSDIDSNGTMNTVTYSLGDSTLMTATQNPRDKVLIIDIDGVKSTGPSLGLVDLRFTYKNGKGVVTPYLDSVKYIQAEIWVETPEPVDDQYLFTYWEMTINPRNL